MRALLFLLSLLSAGCNNTVVVELQTGAQTFDLDATALGVPTELRDGAVIASIDCSGTGICPSTAEVPVTCASGVCDPDALTVAVPVGDVVDFDSILAEASPVIRIVDEIQIVQADYAVSPNGLTFELPETEILWAPASAVSVDDATLLGTLPAVPALTSANGEVALDATGGTLLSDYVLNTAAQIRFFARTRVDLAPGSTFPDGTATAVVNLRVRAVGRIID